MKLEDLITWTEVDGKFKNNVELNALELFLHEQEPVLCDINFRKQLIDLINFVKGEGE